MSSDPSSEGKRLIEAWIVAEEERARTQREATSASVKEANARSALYKWLVPEGVEVGATFGEWHGDTLYSVQAVSPGAQARIITRARTSRG